MESIREIEVSKLRIHPKNVRKSYNDIEELADSIKAQGILQNLTVVPNPEEEGTYWVVIGNRRLTAAMKAGIETVPCKITEMSEKDQASTMLLENMQRNDLTIYEQAQGFQMVLDLGETEEGLAKKTGFSKTTIRRRLNIAKLNQKTLQEKEEKEGFQLTLTDLYELEKIKDIKTRDKILKEAKDSRDLAWKAKNAVNEQKEKENLKLYAAALQKLKIKKAPKEVGAEFYSGKWERVAEYNLGKEPPKTFKFKDNGEQLFYHERYGTLYVVRKAKKEKKVLTPEEQKKKQNDRNKRQLKALLKSMTDTRRVFIEGIISGEIAPIKEATEIEEALFEMMLSYESFVGHNTLKEFFHGKECYNATKEENEEARKKGEALNLLHKMLCIVSALAGRLELMEWDYTYRISSGEKIKALYGILEKYGFSFTTDEEKAAVNGTSELYVKKQEGL